MPSNGRKFKKGTETLRKHQEQSKPKELDRQRGNSNSRGYGYKWQQYRKGYLNKRPLCVRCYEQGIVTAATVVDHIQPHKLDMKLFWKKDNHQGLCIPCHNTKTATEDGGFGNEIKQHTSTLS